MQHQLLSKQIHLKTYFPQIKEKEMLTSRLEKMINNLHNSTIPRKSLELISITLEETVGEFLKREELIELEVLTIKDTYFNNPEQAKAFAEAISGHSNLKKLIFEECNFSSEAVQAMAESLSKTNLEEISFSLMMASSEGINGILQSVSKSPNLKYIRFNVIKFNTDLVHTLNNIVENNTLLQEVEIKESIINDDENKLGNIIGAYKKNNHPITFNLDDCVSEEIQTSLNKRTAEFNAKEASSSFVGSV